jgi:hypothetical protein
MPTRRSSLPMTLRIALVTATAAVLAAAAPASASAAGVGGFGARPAPTHAAGNRPAGPYFALRTYAQHRMLRQVIVSNSSGRAVRLLVDPVDGMTGATSGSVYAGRGPAPARAGRWIRPAVRQLTLAPHTSRRVRFAVYVPFGASPGNHLGGLAFQNVRARRSGGRFAIRQVVRVVVGVEITVPGPAARHLALEGVGIHALGGTAMPAVMVAVHNTGRRLCRPDLAVTLGGRGLPARTVHRSLDTVLPGDTINYPVPWPQKLKNGSYSVAVSATACGTAVTHATAHLGTVLAGTASRPGVLIPDQTSPAHPATTPWWIFALVAVAGTLAGLALSRTRRRVAPA